MGRIADRTVTDTLNWHIGDRLTITGTPGVILARRDPSDMIILAARQYVATPAMPRAAAACIPRPHAAAEKHSHCARRIWTSPSA